MDTLLERFLRYVTFHTRSDETNPACPSSEGQLIFARALHEEMKALGLEPAFGDSFCPFRNDRQRHKHSKHRTHNVKLCHNGSGYQQTYAKPRVKNDPCLALFRLHCLIYR